MKFPKFITREELVSIYRQIDSITTTNRLDTIHGELKRVRDYPLSALPRIWDRINGAVESFFRTMDVDVQGITCISEQLVINPAGCKGQSHHMDTWGQYATVLLYLTGGKSTRFLDVPYCDVSRKDPPFEELYPADWQERNFIAWNTSPGDLLVFWSNFPHSAPENTSANVRYTYYAAFLPRKVQRRTAENLLKSELERPIFSDKYLLYLQPKASRANRKDLFLIIYISCSSPLHN